MRLRRHTVHGGVRVETSIGNDRVSLPLSFRVGRWTFRHLWHRTTLPLRRFRRDRRAAFETAAYIKNSLSSSGEGAALLIGDFSGNTGLSRGAAYDVDMLRARHAELDVIDIGPLRRGIGVVPDRTRSYRFVYLFAQPDNFSRILRLFDPKQFENAYRVGRWVWETPHFPESWRFALRIVHEIWTPSAFSAQGLGSGGLPVRVVPHHVSPPATSSDGRARARFGVAEDAFLGLAIMDLQSCPERKNPWAHVIAWKKAFASRPDAVLLLKLRVGKRTRCVLDELAHLSAEASNMRFLTEDMSAEDIAALQGAADVHLSLHRSEGYGLTIHEGLLTGRPVVATDWSANAEFGRDFPNYHPVRYRMVPYRDWMGQYPGPRFEWADADTDHASELLRTIEAGKRR